jgi:hypothetical protein
MYCFRGNVCIMSHTLEKIKSSRGVICHIFSKFSKSSHIVERQNFMRCDVLHQSKFSCNVLHQEKFSCDVLKEYFTSFQGYDKEKLLAKCYKERSKENSNA